jgi:hypothetical protein
VVAYTIVLWTSEDIVRTPAGNHLPITVSSVE